MAYSKKNKRLLSILLFILGLVVVTEIVLRQSFGFCNAVTFRTDTDFEYIQIPQKRWRFRNNIFFNSLSQRNPEISKSDSIVCLIFGDSIVNGGATTDQDSLATSLLTNALCIKYKKKVVAINISTASWGPDNCFAYLKKHGNFGAKNILLIVSSHDAYDNMDFKEVVGKDPGYPNVQYKLAIMELVDRYIYAWIKSQFSNNISPASNIPFIDKSTPTSEFNTGFINFKNYCDSAKMDFKIYLHAEISERENMKYNSQGREIVNFCEKNNICLIKELDFGFPKEAYRDQIHLTNRGQYFLFKIICSLYL